MSAYTEHFSGSDWSSEKLTQDRLREQSKATIELSNQYIIQVRNNNDQIVNILRENYAFIDTDDIETLQEFIVDSLRMNKEIVDERLKAIPDAIYNSLGEISYSRPEFLDGIKSKFVEKQDILKKYH